MSRVEGVKRAGFRELASGSDGYAGTGGEVGEGLGFGEERLVAGGEPLLGGLFGHAHRGADLAPRGPRPACLAHEVTDQRIGLVTELSADDNGIGEVVEGAAVRVE